MSKIVQAVNAMISNPDNIKTVIQGQNELFFLYKDKYKWSMRREQDGEHFLYFYPGGQTLEALASHSSPEDWEGIDMVSYRDKELGTKEARASFAELYMILRERVFGVNKVLDEIIDDLPF